MYSPEEILKQANKSADRICKKHPELESYRDDIVQEVAMSYFDEMPKHGNAKKSVRGNPERVICRIRNSYKLDDETSSGIYRFPAIPFSTVEKYASAVLNAKEIDDVLNTLTQREERVIKLYFGFDGTPETFREIGEELGVGLERARIISVKALRKLRHPARVRRMITKYTIDCDPQDEEMVREYVDIIRSSRDEITEQTRIDALNEAMHHRITDKSYLLTEDVIRARKIVQEYVGIKLPDVPKYQIARCCVHGKEIIVPPEITGIKETCYWKAARRLDGFNPITAEFYIDLADNLQNCPGKRRRILFRYFDVPAAMIQTLIGEQILNKCEKYYDKYPWAFIKKPEMDDIVSMKYQDSVITGLIGCITKKHLWATFLYRTKQINKSEYDQRVAECLREREEKPTFIALFENCERIDDEAYIDPYILSVFGDPFNIMRNLMNISREREMDQDLNERGKEIVEYLTRKECYFLRDQQVQ